MTPAWGQVDLWVAVPEAVSAERLTPLMRSLSEDELARAAGFSLALGRQRFIVARALLRQALSRYADVPPEAWRLVRGAHGKPRLAGAQAALGLCFNVSHTPGLAVCAIARSEVGVDVQDVTRPPPVRIGELYLAEREREALRALPEGERAGRFFAHWTLKEAYLKARGIGLSLPLAQIGFELTPLEGEESARSEASVARLWLGPGCPDDGRRYWLSTWRASGEHRVALALAQPPQGSPPDALSAPAGAAGVPRVLLRTGLAELGEAPRVVSPPP